MARRDRRRAATLPDAAEGALAEMVAELISELVARGAGLPIFMAAVAINGACAVVRYDENNATPLCDYQTHDDHYCRRVPAPRRS